MKNIFKAMMGFTALAALSLSVSCGSSTEEKVDTSPKLSVSEAAAPHGTATCDPNTEAFLDFSVNIEAPEGIQEFKAVILSHGVEDDYGSTVTGETPDFVHSFSIKCLPEAIDDATTVTFKVTDNKGQTDELVVDLKLAP